MTQQTPGATDDGSAHGAARRGFEYPVGPVDGLLRSAAEAHPDRIAVRCAEFDRTYAQLDQRVDSCAAALQAGIAAPGDVVALASPLHPAFLIAFHGIIRAGCVVAPINPFMREGDLCHLLSSTGAKVAILTPPLLGQLAAIRDQLPELRTVIVLGPPTGPAPEVRALMELMAEHEGEAPAPRTGFDPDDVACLQFTSGTTGAPKAARLTHRNLMANAAHVSYAHELTDGSVVLNFMPKYHLLHMNSALRARATQVLHAADGIPESVAAADAAGATHYYTIPMRLARLAASPEFPGLRFSTVRMIASGGSALSPNVAAALTRQFGIPVFQGYGLAETSSLTHSGGPSAHRPGSVGRAVQDTEYRIVDLDTGAVLGTGGRGELQVRGPQLMKGYVNRPGSGDGFTADGWLATGDVGRVDEDGFLFLVDRIKDVFKCDNFLVSPSEIEHVLARQPGVRDCLVVDVPDEFSGAVAAAQIVLVPGQEPGKVQEIVDAVNALHPHYQHLRHVEVVSEIPRAPMGKVDRKRARAALAATRQTG